MDHSQHAGHVGQMETMDVMTDSTGEFAASAMSSAEPSIPPPFCTGSASMYMSGFRSTLASGDGSQPCLNLFFETWTLDSAAKFVFGALFVFMLAAMTEGLSALRRGVRRWMKPGIERKTLSVVTHALQATMGYALMLSAMTYSAEMFLAVVSGMATGYALFFDDVGRVKGMAMGDGGGGGRGGAKMAADHCLVDDAECDEAGEEGDGGDDAYDEGQASSLPGSFMPEMSVTGTRESYGKKGS